MKSTGVVRKIDELGRVVVPIELRRGFNLDGEEFVKVIFAKTGVRIERMDSPNTEGIKRRFDDLGRVVIPSNIRETLNIKEKDPVEFYVDGECIFIKKYVAANACVVTGDVLEENRVIAGLTLSPAAIERMKKELAVQ